MALLWDCDRSAVICQRLNPFCVARSYSWSQPTQRHRCARAVVEYSNIRISEYRNFHLFKTRIQCSKSITIAHLYLPQAYLFTVRIWVAGLQIGLVLLDDWTQCSVHRKQLTFLPLTPNASDVTVLSHVLNSNLKYSHLTEYSNPLFRTNPSPSCASHNNIDACTVLLQLATLLLSSCTVRVSASRDSYTTVPCGSFDGASSR